MNLDLAYVFTPSCKNEVQNESALSRKSGILGSNIFIVASTK